ncbi:MAG: hypothetical protein H7323_10650, partial [Frankiales bacterium]|nr:hypothetical protein [Frankiales bacterium]
EAYDGGPLLQRLLAQRRYLLGLTLDLLGFLATAYALRSLPLFLVQSALAASIGVTALLSRARLTARETGSLVALGVGLIVLAASATDGAARPVGNGAGRALLLGALALAAAAVLSRRTLSRQPLAGPALAAVAGLTGGAASICARLLVLPDPAWHAVTMPLVWALAIFGVMCAWAFATALITTSATVATALSFGVATVLPTLVGLGLLGDVARSLPAVVIGVALVLVATVRLARFAEPAALPVATG